MPAIADFFERPAEELFEDREGKPFVAPTGPGPVTRTYTRRFLVRTRSKTLASMSVVLCPGVPRPYDVYFSGNAVQGFEYDPYALMVGASARQQADDWFQWVVTCEYSTNLGGGGVPTNPGYPGDPAVQNQPPTTGGAANDPSFEPPEVDWDFETVQVVPRFDLDRKPFLNSARQPFTPGPTVEAARAVLTVTKNELSFTWQVARDWSFAVNNKPFLGADTGQAQCMPPRAKMLYRGTLKYWRVTYKIRFKEDMQDGRFQIPQDWQPQFLDQGMMQLQKDATKPNFDKPVPIMRGVHQVNHPVLLDGQGLEAVPNLAGAIRPNWIGFRLYRERDFDDLITRGFLPP